MITPKDAECLLKNVNNMSLLKEADVNRAESMIWDKSWYDEDASELMSEKDLDWCRWNVSCIGLIRATIIYGGSFNNFVNVVPGGHRYCDVLGMEYVQKLFNVQQDYIMNCCRIDHSSYDNCEGTYYNSLNELAEEAV